MPATSQPFLFACCREGSEASLKADVLRRHATLLGAQDREQRRREKDRKDETYHVGWEPSLERPADADKQAGGSARGDGVGSADHVVQGLRRHAALLGAQDWEQRRRKKDREDETYHVGWEPSLERPAAVDKQQNPGMAPPT